MAEKWTNTSAPPPSTVMKPKPLSALNHFTVPCAMLNSPSENAGPPVHRDEALGRWLFSCTQPFSEDVLSAPPDPAARWARVRRNSTPRTQKLATLYLKNRAQSF